MNYCCSAIATIFLSENSNDYYSMYSKYSLKELSLAKTLPLKLRMANNKTKINQVGVIRKLTEIFCERVNQKNYEINHNASQLHPAANNKSCRSKTN